MNLLVAEKVIERSAHMAQVDPHGWIITMVSIALVFLVLLMLCVIYSISGYYFTHRHLLHRKSHQIRKENMTGDEEAAAIVAALRIYMDEMSVHDRESGIITIKRK